MLYPNDLSDDHVHASDGLVKNQTHVRPLERAEPSSSASNGGLPPTSDLPALRDALVADFGDDRSLTDAELLELARETLVFMEAVLRVAAAQRARGL